MPIIVQKFGGTSVGDADKIRRVARIITDTVERGYQVVAVVSAMGHSTDHLVDLAKEINPYPCGREYDALLATGEMVSAALMAMALNTMGYDAIGLNGPQAGIQTEAIPNTARILRIDASRIRRELAEGKIVIVTGFQGLSPEGDITTLGRGGSDTSAVALAAALNAQQCDIYTDVRGIYSTDPRIVPEAVKLDRIAYIEMMELARSGAQVLHPRAVEIARHWNVPLAKRSTFDLEDPGTMVVDLNAIESDRSVTGVASDDSQVRVAIRNVPDQPGTASKVFGTLAQHHISVDMIIQSLASDSTTNDMAFTVKADDLPRTLEVLDTVKSLLQASVIDVDDDIAKISVVGAGMIDRPGIAADMFDALAEARINIKMISTSEIKISCLVSKAKMRQAVQVIHQRFFPQAPSPDDGGEVRVNQKLGY